MVLEFLPLPTVLNKFFLNPIGIYALAALIPLIILYLIRPKPKRRVIPSLMFLMKDKDKAARRSFLRTFMRDLLFLLQILALIFFALAMAQPFVELNTSLVAKETALVIDVSSSTKATHGSGTRFDTIMKEAKDSVGDKNTIVLAANTPELILQGGSSGEAKDIIDTLEPTDTTTNLYDSMLMAGDYVGDGGRVVVISDFIDTETVTSLDVAKSTLEARGIEVVFKPVFESVRNIGIIDVDAQEDRTSVVVKNYDDQARTVPIKVADVEESLQIEAGRSEVFSFNTPPGVSKVELSIKDHFSADNTAYISAPRGVAIKVLLVTNDPSKHLTTALSLINHVELEQTEPPRVPEFDDYDVIIFHNIDKTLILPGSFKDAREAAAKGKTVIVMAQDDLFEMDTKDLMPVTYRGKGNVSQVLKQLDSDFIQDIDFGGVDEYFIVDAKQGSITYAAAEDATPLVVLEPVGLGEVIYYGIIDEKADFMFNPFYPIFWKRLLRTLGGIPDIKDLNYKTGHTLNLGEALEIKTPKGKVRESVLKLDDAGIYELPRRSIAVTLSSDRESDVSGKGVGTAASATVEETVERKLPESMTKYAIALLLLIIMLELLYIKMRGDL